MFQGSAVSLAAFWSRPFGKGPSDLVFDWPALLLVAIHATPLDDYVSKVIPGPSLDATE